MPWIEYTLTLVLVCGIFPAGTLSRHECEYRDRQGVQHPEVRPHVDAPPIEQDCAEARAGMRWSEMPCGPEGAKEQPGKNATVPRERKQ
jgi:hypothetical protein